MHHDYIGTEHLLLGLIRDPSNKASQILISAGMNLNSLKDSIQEVVQTPSEGEMPERLPMTQRSIDTLLAARDEAAMSPGSKIGPEHILLALMKDTESVAAKVLDMYDFEYPKAKALLMGMQ